MRSAQESAIYRRMLGGTLSTGRLVAASVTLAELAARHGAFRSEAQTLGETRRRLEQAAETARTDYRQCQRRAEALDAVQQVVRGAARTEAEKTAERALEDLHARGGR